LVDPFVAVQTANDSDVHGNSMGLSCSCLSKTTTPSPRLLYRVDILFENAESSAIRGILGR
jgi:hypothetical protein